MNKIIQIANLDETKRKFTNPQCGRVYYAKGISPTLNTCGGGRQTTQIFSDMQTKVNTTPPSCATPSDGATTAMGPRMCMEASTARADFTSIRTLAA